MNVSEIFDFVLFLANKYQAKRISAEEFNLACIAVSAELFNVKVGLPEDYQVGAPYARQAWQVSQKITDDLQPFILDLSITKTQGYFPLPANYAALSSLSYKYILNSDCGEDPISEIRPVQVVTDGELRVRLNDNVIMPTLRYPVATYRAQGILVYPKEITTITLTYLRHPIPPVYGYTIVNDEYVYNPATSTQCDLPLTLHSEFAIRVARYAGINMRENDFEQYMEARLAKGN